MNFATSNDLLAQDQLLALGLIAAEWSMLEAVVSVAIWDHLAVSRTQGLSVTADLGSLAKIKMLRALADDRFKNDTEAHEKIKSITGLMEAYNTKRNDILHNVWEPDSIPGSLRSKKFTTREGKLKEKPLSLNPNELIAVYTQITGLVHAILQFQVDYGVTPPSRTTRPQQD
jgi:hypothetical protein